jgi:hypothetical protein
MKGRALQRLECLLAIAALVKEQNDAIAGFGQLPVMGRGFDDKLELDADRQAKAELTQIVTRHKLDRM